MSALVHAKRRFSRIWLALLPAVLAGGCHGGQSHFADLSQRLAAEEQIETTSMPAPVALEASRKDALAPREVSIFPGASALTASNRPVEVRPGGKVELDLIDVDVEAAARAVLGDLLKVNYTIDPQVSGRVTLKTPSPVTIRQSVALLETSLAQSGIILTERDGGYVITMRQDGKAPSGALAVRNGAAGGALGFGARAVSLKYVSAKEMADLIQQLQPDAVARIDAEHNVIVLRGTGADFNALLETVRTFDVDWLANKSVGLFRVETMSADQLARSLLEILTNENINGSLAKVTTLDANNSVLVVAKTPQILTSVRRWVARLDRPSASALRLHTYEMRHARASQVAPLIASALGFAAILGNQNAPGGSSRGGGSAGGSFAGASSAGGSSLGSGAGGFGSGGFGSGGLASSSGGSAGTGSSAAPGSASVGSTSSGYGGSTSARLGGGSLVDPARALLGQSSRGVPGQQGGAEASQPRVVVDETSNKLLFYSTGDQFNRAKEFLAALDIPEKQVLVEATVVEVTLTDSLRYGTQYFIDRVINGTKITGSLAPGSAGIIGPQTPGASLAVGLSTQGIIDTLNQVTRVNVISSPNLMVLNNQPARLIVGDQVPITRQTSSNPLGNSNNTIVNSIDFRDTGIIFDVTPHVNAAGSVTLDILQEVSSVKPGGQTLTPTIAQRRLNSVVTAHNNETIVLGGLFSTDNQSAKAGLPFISQITGIGGAFGTQSNTTNKTELLVLLSVRIVKDREEARVVTRQMRDRLESLKLGGPPACSGPLCGLRRS